MPSQKGIMESWKTNRRLCVTIGAWGTCICSVEHSVPSHAHAVNIASRTIISAKRKIEYRVVLDYTKVRLLTGEHCHCPPTMQRIQNWSALSPTGVYHTVSSVTEGLSS